MHLNIKFLGVENGDMINMDFAITSFYTQSHNPYIVHTCDITSALLKAQAWNTKTSKEEIRNMQLSNFKA